MWAISDNIPLPSGMPAWKAALGQNWTIKFVNICILNCFGEIYRCFNISSTMKWHFLMEDQDLLCYKINTMIADHNSFDTMASVIVVSLDKVNKNVRIEILET